jgi:hypothetical protein
LASNLPEKYRPAVTVTGLSLLTAGAVGVLWAGFSLIPALALGLGTLVFLVSRLLRPATPVLDADSGLKPLKRFISKAQYLENVGDLGEKTASQLDEISDRFNTFQKLLLLKFSPEEITYSRYFGSAHQTYLSVLDNLNEVATSLVVINAMAPSRVEERESLREKQIESVKELLALNDRAITEFDRVSTALSDVKTARGYADTDLDAAMQQLAQLAERAKKYSITNSESSDS